MRVTKSLFATLIAVAGILLPGAFRAQAQESFGGTPPSFAATTSLLRSGELTPNVVRVRPDFNPEDIISTNTWAATSSSNGIATKPLQIGRIIDQKIDFIKEARKSTVDGKTIYTLRIESKGAKSMTLYYDDFFIPEGSGELFIYTPDRVNVLGAYTHATHREHGEFANEALPGDVVIMEFAPYLTAGENLLPSIKISGIGYIFRGLEVNHLRGQKDPGEDQSDPSCQVEVNCPEGNEWQAQKAAVAQLMMLIGKDMGLCSGTLINNTAQDFKPYIISAAHCIGASNVPQSDLNKWMFTFHYEKPGCSKAGIAVTRGRTLVGCRLSSFIDINGKSDGLLLELNKKVPKTFRVYYSGWDRSSKIPDKVVGIHHPMGDSKKISICKGNIRIGKWDDGTYIGGTNAHFVFSYNMGDTEGGSSGSGLFNQNHLLVGTLTGGAPGCGSSDSYGRLNYHWDKYKQNGSSLFSMDSFLDPVGEGKETLEGTWNDNMRPLEAVKDLKVMLSEDAKTVNVTWEPVSTEQLPSNWSVKYRIFRNGLYLDGKDVTSGNSYSESVADAQSNTNGNGHVIYAIQARYMYGGDKFPDDGYNNGNEYAFGDADKVQMGAYLGEVKREMPASVTAVPGGGVDVSWKKPGNLQEISLFGYPSNLKPYKLLFGRLSHPSLGVPPYIQLYSKFRADEMVNYDNSSVYISAVSIIPTSKTKDLKISILNGGPETVYEQDVVIPDDWKNEDWVTVELRRPYKINPQQFLFAGVSYNNKPNIPVKICSISDSEDDVSDYRGCVLRIKFSGAEPLFTYPDKVGVNVPGYLAVRLTLSQSAVKYTDDAERGVFVRSNTAVPFPLVKGYIVKKNGETLKEVNKDLNFLTDKNGSTSDNYTVTVLYETPTGNEAPELAPSVAPSVYPTQLAADGILNIANAERVENVAVYSVDGKKLLAIDHPDARIDLTDLAEGSYIVVLTTGSGSITERIFR